MSDQIGVACPVVWLAVRVCNGWGAPGPHGCRLAPGHDGGHVCACGNVLTGQEVLVDEAGEMMW